MWDHLRTDYLDRLIATSVRPEEVDYVFCTHMHVNHVGWNTHLGQRYMGPNIPPCSILISPQRVGILEHTEEKNQAEVVRDSLVPIMEAGLAVMVEAHHVIVDGIWLEFTPILGTHFAPPTAVRIISHGTSFRVRY